MGKAGNPGKDIKQDIRISTYIEPTIAAELYKIAESKNISISSLVREILYREVIENKYKKEV